MFKKLSLLLVLMLFLVSCSSSTNKINGKFETRSLSFGDVNGDVSQDKIIPMGPPYGTVDVKISGNAVTISSVYSNNKIVKKGTLSNIDTSDNGAFSADVNGDSDIFFPSNLSDILAKDMLNRVVNKRLSVLQSDEVTVIFLFTLFDNGLISTLTLVQDK